MLADTGEGGQRLGRDRGEQLGRIAEVLRDRAADLEVQVGHLVARDVAVHLADLRLELARIDERARVRLWQRRVVAHQACWATGSGRTITVSATSVISSAGMPVRSACSRTFSVLVPW